MGVGPVSRDEKKRQRDELIQQAWQDHYYELVSGEMTLAEILQHSDEKLMAIADKGLRLFKLGKLDQARKLLSGLPMLDPYVPYFHLLLAGVHEKMKNFDDALAEYGDTIALCESMTPPGNLLSFALVSRAKLLTRLTDWSAAQADVGRLVSREVRMPDPRLHKEAQLIHDYVTERLAGS